jgi:hypothetical protein
MFIRKAMVALTLAAAAGYAGADANLDDFSIAQGPVSSPGGGSPASNSSGGRTITAMLDSGANNQDAEITGGVFSSSTGDASTGRSSVRWDGAWPGFVSDLSPFAALRVDVVSWDHFAPNTLGLRLNDGTNQHKAEITPSSLSNVEFALDGATFPGVNLSSIDTIELVITDPQDNNDPLDASFAVITLTEVVAAPAPPVVPVMGGFGVLATLLGLFGIGGFFARGRKPKS